MAMLLCSFVRFVTAACNSLGYHPRVQFFVCCCLAFVSLSASVIHHLSLLLVVLWSWFCRLLSRETLQRIAALITILSLFGRFNPPAAPVHLPNPGALAAAGVLAPSSSVAVLMLVCALWLASAACQRSPAISLKLNSFRSIVCLSRPRVFLPQGGLNVSGLDAKASGVPEVRDPQVQRCHFITCAGRPTSRMLTFTNS